jgi:hypothetical protein
MTHPPHPTNIFDNPKELKKIVDHATKESNRKQLQKAKELWIDVFTELLYKQSKKRIKELLELNL